MALIFLLCGAFAKVFAPGHPAMGAKSASVSCSSNLVGSRAATRPDLAATINASG